MSAVPTLLSLPRFLSLSLYVSLFLSLLHLDLKMQQPPKPHSLSVRPSNDVVGAGLPLPAIRGAPNSPKQSRGSRKTLEARFLPASSYPTSLLLRTACHMLPAACLVSFSLQHGDVHRRKQAAGVESRGGCLSRRLAIETMRLERTSCQCWQGHDRAHTSQPRTRDVNAETSSCSRVPSLATTCSQGLGAKVVLETRTCH